MNNILCFFDVYIEPVHVMELTAIITLFLVLCYSSTTIIVVAGLTIFADYVIGCDISH